MEWGRFRGTVLLLVIVAITLLALAVVADSGEATITGSALPDWGDDWVIDQNTKASGETIRLDGDIYVMWPYILSLDGCTVIFNSSYDGQNGINVDYGSVLYINKTTRSAIVEANTSSEMWYFRVYGEAYLDGAELYNLYDGVRSYNIYLWMEDCTVESWRYGVYSYADLHVGNTSIDVNHDGGYSSFTAYGVYTRYGRAELYNLAITIDTSQMLEVSSSSYWSSSNIYGIYAYNANLRRLQPVAGGTFTIDINVDIEVYNHYESSYVYLYHDFMAYGVYLSGSTDCRSMKDLDITMDEHYYGVIYNATAEGQVVVYNDQLYIYSTISSTGFAPLDISGMDFTGLGATVSSGGVAMEPQQYYNNIILYLDDQPESRPGNSITQIHDISVTESMLMLFIYMPRYAEVEVYDCTLSDLYNWALFYSYNVYFDYTIRDCTISKIRPIQNSNFYFYFYNQQAEGTISDNTFDDILGMSMFQTEYSDDRIFISGNTFTNNRQTDDARNAWLYFSDTYNKVTITDNTFDTMTMKVGLVNVQYSDDKFLFEMNEVMDSTFDGYLFRSYYTWGDVSVENNRITDNKGRLFWFERNYARALLKDNVVDGNDIGADYLLYTYYTYGDLAFEYNTFSNNTVDGVLIYFLGTQYWGNYGFSFEQNTLSDNTASTAMNGGIVVFRGIRYDLSIKRNVFSDNKGTCLNFYRPYSSNSVYTYTFTVDGNFFYDNRGTATQWVDFMGYNIIVKRNIGSGNTGPLVDHILTAYYVNDGGYPNCYGYTRGAREITVDGNTYNNNMGGAVDIRAQWSDAFIVDLNRYQVIRVSNNDLQWNGDGYAIRIVDFGPFPILGNNNLWGSNYGMYLDAIDYPLLYPRTKLSYTGESYDGGGSAGMTSWALVDVDAEFIGCSFTNFKLALYARDCQIDVFWSSIPEASGRTDGLGYIYVYNNMEIFINWADAQGMDSGSPVVNARLAMLGKNGRSLGSLVTDSMGHIGPMRVIPWSSIEGKTDVWSPYLATIQAGGLTGAYTVNAVGERVGENAVRLLVDDIAPPEVVVTSPTMDTMSNKVDMPVGGFLFEAGSGILTFMGYLDGATTGTAIHPQLQWESLFPELSQGQHTIRFDVEDHAGNTASTSVSFFIDAVAPTILIDTPGEGDVTSESTILVDGSFSDDVSEASEIVVRINNVILDSNDGVITKNVPLTEGVNTVVVTAQDRAGNIAVLLRRVTLDTKPPTLYVYSPLNQLVTSSDRLEITGLSEAGTPVTIDQKRASSGVIVNTVNVIADSEGLFEAVLTLQEGAFNIVFTAEDTAGNVRTIERMVTLDTTPPTLLIEQPPANTHTKKSFINVSGSIDDPNPEKVMVHINLLEVTKESANRFSKEVPLVEGLNSIIVSATDMIGNTVTRTLNVTRDTVPPDLEVSTSDHILTNVRNLEVRGKVSGAKTVTVADNAVNVEEDGSFAYVVNLAEETSPIFVVATDEAGNARSFPIRFVFDDEKPNLVLTDVPKATISSLLMYVNGTVTDNEAIVTHVMVLGRPYPVVGGKFNIMLPVDTTGDGWNNFTVSAVDDAGNSALQKVSTQYKPRTVDEEDGGTDDTINNDLTYIGLLLIIAAVVVFLTVYVFQKRGERR